MCDDGAPVPNELGSRPDTTEADGECPECEGTLWDLDNETVCGDCSIVLGSSSHSSQSDWEYFFENRPEHWNSERPRCVGGFPWAYDWVRSSDIDGAVSDVDPAQFYR